MSLSESSAPNLPDPNDENLDSLAEAMKRSEELNEGKKREIPEAELWALIQEDRRERE